MKGCEFLPKNNIKVDYEIFGGNFFLCFIFMDPSLLSN